MVKHCANPKCLKPLHYLREGRIFVFDVPENASGKSVNGARSRRMEHYWLCGTCAPSMVLKHSTDEGVRLLARSANRARPIRPVAGLLATVRLAS